MPISFGQLDSVVITGSADGQVAVTGAGVGAGLLLAYADGYVLVDGNGVGEQALNEPIYHPATADGGLQVGGQGTGSGSLFGSASGAILVTGDGLSGSVADGQVYVGGSGTEGSAPGAVTVDVFAVAPSPQIASYVGHWFGFSTDRLIISPAAARIATLVTRELLRMRGINASRFDGKALAREHMLLAERTELVVRLLASDGLVLSTTADVTLLQLARAVARLVLVGGISSTAEALAAIIETWTLAAATEAIHAARITDDLAIADQVRVIYAMVAALVDQLLLGDAVTGTQMAVALVRDGLVLADRITSEAELVAILRDAVGFVATLSIDNGEYIAWAMNTESKALSRYTNYPFNSFAQIGGVWHGCTSDGLYRLEGPDDAGQPITARLRQGLSALGTRKLKRVPEVYIAYSGDKTVLLRVITVNEQSGEKEACIYRMAPRAAGATRENRIKFGRGVQAVDWDFELVAIDGSGFDLASLQFRPLVLDRRTRG